MRNPTREYLTFESTPEFKARLEEVAKTGGRSLSSQIRIMLSDWMATHHPRSVGAGAVKDSKIEVPESLIRSLVEALEDLRGRSREDKHGHQRK